jgi:hypothetical protein
MAWAEPKYTRTRVDSAGKKFTELLARDFLVDEQADEFEEALDTINNWRSSDRYPRSCILSPNSARGSATQWPERRNVHVKRTNRVRVSHAVLPDLLYAPGGRA